MVLRTCADLSPSSDLTSMVSTGMGTVWDASSDQLVHRKLVRPLWLPSYWGLPGLRPLESLSLNQPRCELCHTGRNDARVQW